MEFLYGSTWVSEKGPVTGVLSQTFYCSSQNRSFTENCDTFKNSPSSSVCDNNLITMVIIYRTSDRGTTLWGKEMGQFLFLLFLPTENYVGNKTAPLSRSSLQHVYDFWSMIINEKQKPLSLGCCSVVPRMFDFYCSSL